MFWNREFSDYETINWISTKDAGFGANVTVQESNSVYHNLEEAMDNLAYAATMSNNVVEELVRTNSKLVEHLKAVKEENSRLLKIIELSVTTGCSTAAITLPSGKNQHN
eukprot:15351626-Ditylum_brightwellii.AAC.1